MKATDRATLLDAACLVLGTIEGLDLRSSVCECCGLTRYENFQDAKDAEILRGIVTKLERLGSPRRRESAVTQHHQKEVTP